MSYMNASINTSNTAVEEAGATLSNAQGLFLKHDGNGKVVLAGDGESIAGILLLDQADSIASGGRVTLAIKDIVHVKAGAAFAKGAYLASNASGQAITAATGKYIVAKAMGAATAAGQYVPVMIIHSGAKA